MPAKSLRQPLSNLPSNENAVEYEVEKVIKYCKERDEYLIKWRGYRKPTYEPIENLGNCIQLLNEARKRQRLKPLRVRNQDRCGAIEKSATILNPGNWVSLREICDKIRQILNERFPRMKMNVKEGPPRETPNIDCVFVMNIFNHSVGIFYRAADQCGYVYDSENASAYDKGIQIELKQIEKRIKLKALPYGYSARVDYCGSQLVAATIDLISWHRHGLVPAEIRPSPVIRKRVEKCFHKEKSVRTQAVNLTKCAQGRKIICPSCNKFVRRKGGHLHLAKCVRQFGAAGC